MDKVENGKELSCSQDEYLENLKNTENGETIANIMSSKEELFIGRIKFELKNINRGVIDQSTRDHRSSYFLNGKRAGDLVLEN